LPNLSNPTLNLLALGLLDLRDQEISVECGLEVVLGELVAPVDVEGFSVDVQLVSVLRD